MDIERIAAFADGDKGGNPAGVLITEALPEASEMLRIAAEIGYSETAFAAREGDGFRVRYFAPEAEVPFCGHATIALGAALGRRFGPGRYALALNEAEISVEATEAEAGMEAALQSPPTRSRPADPGLLRSVLEAFSLTAQDLDPRLAPALAHAGADHLVLPLAKRERLAAMAYPFETMKTLMQQIGLVTINLIWFGHDRLIHSRNAFAFGGVVEDPATGAAAAALAGYLRDADWPHGGNFEIRQGEDMGAPSRLSVSLTDEPGASIRVAGKARWMA